MEFGIGVDIEEISRFKGKTLKNSARFLKRLFTEAELNYCFRCEEPAAHLAARFVAKESAMKALSSLGINGHGYQDIIVGRSKGGGVKLILKKIHNKRLKAQLSISHCKDLSIAFVVIQK